MFNIAIIGAGQLGSRHLQGLKKITLEVAIFIVDPDQNSLNTSRERYNQVQGNPLIESISYLKDISFLPNVLDIVIVATGSKPRASIIQLLLGNKKVKYLILEKFLFPSVHEYQEIANLLEQKQVKTWVNCSRRMFSFYRELKELLSGYKYLKYSIIGTNWGLACNAIHFLDHFAMLMEHNEFSIDVLLESEIIESKRKDYIEFTGTIKGSFNNSEFVFTSKQGTEAHCKMEIKTDKYFIEVDESVGIIDIKYLNTNEIISKQVHIPYQSELTNIMVEQILKTGESDLTEYSESAKLHLQFLIPVVDFYNKITGNKSDMCPIT
jgi:hypothetical protein